MEGEGDGRVQVISSPQDYALALMATNKLIVVYFTAPWCGPCRSVGPKVAELSLQYQNVDFLKIDVDDQKELAGAMNVTSIPSFFLIKNQATLETFTGANPTKLEQLIKKHTMGLAMADDDPLPLPAGHYDLDEAIDKTQCSSLNQNANSSVQNIFVKDPSKYLESDCDEQLLIYVPFKQVIRLHSICFVAPDDGRGPKGVKIFVNNPHMDFGSTDGLATQEFDLTPEDLNESTLTALKFVKFQNVSSVTIFVESNQGGCETSVLSRIRFVGQPLDTSDMKNFKRVAGEKNEVHG